MGDELVKMGTINSSKDQALYVGVSNPSKGNKKAKDSQQKEKKKKVRPKYSNGGLNPCKDKDKKKQ